MRISAARVTCFRLPLVAPLATAHGAIAARDGALLEIATRAGLCGFGEAMPLPGFGLESFEESQRALAALARGMLGCDVRELGAALAWVLEAAPRAPAARAAADCALHDLAAREAGVSVASLLAGGSATRASVRASALVTEDEPAAAARCALRRAAAGFDTLKLKVGADLERDLRRIAAVHTALPRSARIRLDANGAFAAREAEAALARFARFEPEFVEQPLATHDAASWARLRAASPVPIAADESVRDEESARALLEAGAVDWLVLKPAALGGLAAAWRIAELARASGVRVVVTSFLDSAIGRTAALQLAAALPGAAAAAGLATGSLLADDLASMPDGALLAVPAEPGLGVRPDLDALARCRSARVAGACGVSGFAAALAARAECTPKAPAVTWRGREVSFAALAARAASAAERLRALGVRPGDRVAVLMANGPAFVEVLHGAIACEAVLLPVNTRLAPPEIAQLLRDAEPRVLLHGEALTPLALASCAGCEVPPGCVEVGEHFADLRVATNALSEPACSGDPLVALLYTSGTTGRPKGVMLAASNLRASAEASRRNLDVREGDGWLACLPLFHVGGLSLLLRSVIDGSCVVLQERFDAAAVSAAIDRGEVAFASLVPTLLDRLLRARGERVAPASLRAILLGGASASVELLARAERLGFPVATTYGLTEAASQVATRRLGSPGAGLTALPGTRVRIAAEGGAPCAAGEPGEILVAGETVMRGYWRRSEETARALAGGWLRTGDIGLLDAAGDLHVLARRSDLIVSGGENVYPAEVEAVLASHPQVCEVAVAGVPDAEFGARPAAWIVAEPAIDADTLHHFCRARLAGFKVPVVFHFVASLPRNATGKLLRDHLLTWGRS